MFPLSSQMTMRTQPCFLHLLTSTQGSSWALLTPPGSPWESKIDIHHPWCHCVDRLSQAAAAATPVSANKQPHWSNVGSTATGDPVESWSVPTGVQRRTPWAPGLWSFSATVLLSPHSARRGTICTLRRWVYWWVGWQALTDLVWTCQCSKHVQAHASL